MNRLYAYLRLYANFFNRYENDREKENRKQGKRSMMILKLPTNGF
ncbi:hypothetical protein [Thermospira aquatica]|nr:hypothetical protein [Thermospira aquatica]